MERGEMIRERTVQGKLDRTDPVLYSQLQTAGPVPIQYQLILVGLCWDVHVRV